MGFNAMQPGKVKKGDILFFVWGIAVLVIAFLAVFLFVK